MKFAVAIPFYNEEETIIKTLSSFLYKPFYDNLVFVLVDNNSTDRSRQRVHEFAKKHHSIKMIVSEEPKHGVIYARKKALDTALSLNPLVIVGTDADTVFNKEILIEILKFSSSKKFDVFAGRGTIDAQTKLERLIFVPEFVKLTKLLWDKEFELFGPYFFGACFAIKSSFYKKIVPYFDIDESLIIKDGGGEDLLLARRAYYMGANFFRSKSRVLTSPRRYLSDPLSWMVAKRKNLRGKKKIAEATFQDYVNKNKKSIITKRLKNTVDRWIRTAVDANSFYYKTGKKFGRARIAAKNFCSFFEIPMSELGTSNKNQTRVYKKLVDKYGFKSEKILLDFVG